MIPKIEDDYIFNLDDKTLAGLMLLRRKVALAQKEAIPCQRIGVAVLGMEVPHVHIHLVPLDNEKDLNFSNPKLKLSDEEMSEIAKNKQQNRQIKYLPTPAEASSYSTHDALFFRYFQMTQSQNDDANNNPE